MRSLVLVLSILTQVITSSAWSCTWDKFEQCKRQLPVLGRNIIPEISDTELTQICGILDTPCLQELRAVCVEEEKAAQNQTTAPPQTTEAPGDTLVRVRREAASSNSSAVPDVVNTTDTLPGQEQDSQGTTRTPDSTTRVTATPAHDKTTTTKTPPMYDSTTTAPPRGHTEEAEEETHREGDVHERQAVRLKKIIQAINETVDVLTYLCSTSNSAVYKQTVRPCLTEHVTDLHQSGNTCLGKYVNRTWWLNTELPENVYKFCSAATNYLDCLKVAVTNTCGTESSSWVIDYHMSVWSAHLQDISCQYGGGMSPGAIAIISICGAAAGLAVLFTILGFVVKPKVKVEEPITKNGSVPALKEQGSATSSSDARPPREIPPNPERGILKKRNPRTEAAVL